MTLTADRTDNLRSRLSTAEFDAVLTLSSANVHYATGYRSLGAAVHGVATLSALVGAERTIVTGPVADSAPAFDTGVAEDDFVAYGRFYFESADGSARATRLVDEHQDAASAIVSAVRRAGLEHAAIGLDDAATPSHLRDALSRGLPGVRWIDASPWLDEVRARKLPAEVDLLERSARAAEDGIAAAIAAARVGMSEKSLARIVSTTLVGAGLEPRFVVVTSGERSALADAYPSERTLRPGDLVRFDVGGTLEGYWSDIGRTAVVGEPKDRQRQYYDALLAGEEAELSMAAPGVVASDIFDRAIAVVEKNGGPKPYRRQHVGHGIGLTTYEPPIVRPMDAGVLQPGMVFCFETPFYELGWGGMMVEDALVITEDGCRRLTDRVRGLTVIEG
jgi:Xaa-Pro aminopeptidase